MTLVDQSDTTTDPPDSTPAQPTTTHRRPLARAQAELEIGAAVITLADEFPDLGIRALNPSAARR